MHALAKYSTPALAGLMTFAGACSDAAGPDTNRLSLDPGASAATRKNPGSVPPPADVTPPTAPVLSSTDVGRRHISLAWSSTDDRTGNIYYRITVNGAPDPYGPTWDRSRTYYALQPATTYTFVARATDYAGNLSAPSASFSVTTQALDPGDKQAPSAPANLWANDFGSGDREFQLTWTASTDNADSQADLVYEVYINGALSDVGAGKTVSSNYGVSGTNRVTVIAIDSNGNRSEAGATTIVFNF
jgi:chitin-binding protein